MGRWAVAGIAANGCLLIIGFSLVCCLDKSMPISALRDI
jgi:hypothetical protein